MVEETRAPAIELVVGLGNPGAKYEGTRHNCGFMTIDLLSQRYAIALKPSPRFQGLYGEGRGPKGNKLRLLKPETFMNRSGQSVRAVKDWFKLPAEAILIVYDDMDIPFGRLRLRQSGSAGSHNGMKSLVQHLGSQQFPRLRVGIGSPGASRETISHVLGGFTPREKQYLEDVIYATADAVEAAIAKDLPTAMNRFNPLNLYPTPAPEKADMPKSDEFRS
ncbi:MAG: aminoacyl-tRNA hydrolase [Cyanobacteria bacterium P01_F01_bin.33]